MDLFKTNRKKRSKGPSSPPPFTISGPVGVAESTYIYPTSSISPPPDAPERFTSPTTSKPPPPLNSTASWSQPPTTPSNPTAGLPDRSSSASTSYAQGSSSQYNLSGLNNVRRTSKTNSTSTVSTQGSNAVSPSYAQSTHSVPPTPSTPAPVPGPSSTTHHPRQSTDQLSLMSTNSTYTAYSDVPSLSDRVSSVRGSGSMSLPRSVPSYLTQAIDLASDNEVHSMFEELIDSMGIPESKRNYMRSIPVDSKRTMLRAKQQQTKKESDSVQSQANPTYFIDKISGVDLRYVPVQIFTGLRVSIMTHPISWIREFIDEKGLVMLAECLGKLNHRPQRREQDLDQELEIMRALKTVLNLSWGANEVLNYPRCVANICHSLDSPHLLIRKLAAELLTFLCYSEIPRGHAMVLQGMEAFQRFRSMEYRFEPWLNTLERTVDGRGRMGSMVGASQEIRQAGMLENDLVHYGLCNVLLMNAIIEVCDEVEVRVHLRQELAKCGIHRIQEKLLEFNHEHIQHQIDKYEREAEHDNNEVMEFHHFQALQDMSDPHEVFEALLSSLEGRSTESFISILQHLLLIREDAETKGRYMQLIDHLISQVVLDRRGVDSDFSSAFGVSVATLTAKFADEEQLVEALSELRETKEQLEQVRRGKNELELEVSMKADGLVQALKAKIMTLEDLLRMSRHTIMALQNQIKELREQFQGKLMTQDTQLKQMVKTLENQTEEQTELHESHAHLEIENQALRTGEVMDIVEEPVAEPSAPPVRRLVVNPQKLHREMQRLGASAPITLQPRHSMIRQSISRQSNLFAGASRAGTGFEFSAPGTTGAGRLGPLGSVDDIINASHTISSRNKMAAAKAKLEMLFEEAGDELARQNRLIDNSGASDDGASNFHIPTHGCPASTTTAPTTTTSAAAAGEFQSSTRLFGSSSSAASTPHSLAARLAERANMSGASSPSSMFGSPPPPPPSSGGLSVARRKEIRFVPKVKLKQLQWDKLDEFKVSSSVWGRNEAGEILTSDKLEEIMFDKGVLTQMESMFSAKAAAIDLSKRTVGARRPGKDGNSASPGGAAVGNDDEPLVKETISVLDPKRAHNINLMLGRLKQYSFADLRRAVLRCDNQILTENLLNQLLTYIPTASERGLLSAYKDDTESLANADAFFAEMMKVDRYEQRLKMLLFWTTFEEKFGYLRQDVTGLLRACEALPNSEHFPQVLETILMMGNFMNGSGFRGGAFGFKINSLNKLVDTKASDNKTTLLHFLAEVLQGTLPDSLQFLQEFKGIEDACRVSSNELKKDVNDMKGQLAELGTELDVFKRKLTEAQENKLASGDDGTSPGSSSTSTLASASTETAEASIAGNEDRFLLVMTSFHDIAKDRFQGIEQMYTDMQSRYSEVADLYGEDSKRMPPEEFFGIFRTFSSSFEKALKDNEAEKERKAVNEKRRQRILERDSKRKEQQKEKERRLLQLQQQQQQQQMGSSGGRPGDGAGGESGTEKGVMDNLLQSLITGNDFDTLSRRKKRDLMSRRRSELRRSLRRTSLGTKALEMLQKIKESDGSEDGEASPATTTTTADSRDAQASGSSTAGTTGNRSRSSSSMRAKRSGISTNSTLASAMLAYPPSPLGPSARRSPSNASLNGKPPPPALQLSSSSSTSAAPPQATASSASASISLSSSLPPRSSGPSLRKKSVDSTTFTPHSDRVIPRSRSSSLSVDPSAISANLGAGLVHYQSNNTGSGGSANGSGSGGGSANSSANNSNSSLARLAAENRMYGPEN
ncbi:hypothetical protein H4R33_003872 [Dimargaris cristalligena]|nr:hypothetical protein H4R33_003872 [Dimargaris cristalligena]